MARFTGKRVLITGGTSGIGLAGAKRIAAEDGHVLVTGTHRHRLAAVRQELPGARVVVSDAADPSAVETLAEEVADGGGLDGVWLDAGYAAVSDVDEVTADFFDRMMNTNVRGPALQVARLADHLNDGASVVVTSPTSSDDATYVTASQYVVDGGLTKR